MMKTLLVLLLTLTLATVAALAQDSPPTPCDPATDPTCTQQCSRDGSQCVCTWEPDCTPTPRPTGKPPVVVTVATPGPSVPDPAALLDRLRGVRLIGMKPIP